MTAANDPYVATFMAALRGVPAHAVAAALNAQTPGVRWYGGAGKRDIAALLADDICVPKSRVDLARLARDAKHYAEHGELPRPL